MFEGIVGKPITDLVMTSCDESALLVIQIVAYIECVIATSAVGREVWGVFDVA